MVGKNAFFQKFLDMGFVYGYLKQNHLFYPPCRKITTIPEGLPMPPGGLDAFETLYTIRYCPSVRIIQGVETWQ